MKLYDINNNFNEICYEKMDMNKGIYWICCYVHELDDLKNKFDLNEDNIKDCQDFEKATKIEFLNSHIFVTFNILQYYSKGVHSRELYIFLGKHYIITSFKEDLELIENLMLDIDENRNCFILKNNSYPAILLYSILDRIIVKNYQVISQLEAEADKIEISILKRPRHEQLDSLIMLRRQVYKIRKYLNPLRYIGDSLISNDNSIINQKHIEYFISLNNKIDKLMMALESLVQDLALVREAFESEIANKTNELMKIFTIIATIFLPLNLITSMYGMNVHGMPFIHLNNGYYYVLGIMVTVSILLIWIFKRRKWL
ncbi:magnesium transporter CorA family protein [Clostridium rectalis]|uniref:magnesium transporter CorA family protein n=1 Tax=Clostridium rectalis TaxID=2040295 RepID=UPI000F644136|nr:magnesium transporter CorA family protein [Clostridium rectalis]